MTTAILGLERVVKAALDEADIWAEIKDASLVLEVICLDKPWHKFHRYCRYIMNSSGFTQMKVVIGVFRGALLASSTDRQRRHWLSRGGWRNSALWSVRRLPLSFGACPQLRLHL